MFDNITCRIRLLFLQNGNLFFPHILHITKKCMCFCIDCVSSLHSAQFCYLFEGKIFKLALFLSAPISLCYIKHLCFQPCLASDFLMLGLLSTDAAVNSNTSPSQSSSVNDISSMSTEQTLASDTDSSLDALTGTLEGCRWSALKIKISKESLLLLGLYCL